MSDVPSTVPTDGTIGPEPERPVSERAWQEMVQNAVDQLVARVELLEANYKRLEEFALPVLRDVHQGIQDSIVDLKNRVMELEMRGKAKKRQSGGKSGGKGKRGLPAKPAASRSPARQVVRQGARGAPGVKRGRR